MLSFDGKCQFLDKLPLAATDSILFKTTDEVNTEELKTKLTSSKSTARRRAAKEIGATYVYNLSRDLFDQYLQEKLDKRTWETQYEMVVALGKLNYKPVLPEVETIMREERENGMLLHGAAQSFVRLKRSSNNDASPILEILEVANHSIADGLLTPLGYDRMVPSDTEIKKLIELSWNLHKHPDVQGIESQTSDARYGIAAACAGWNKELTRDFLEHCVQTGDAPVRYVAGQSLKGKYAKLR